VVTEEFFDRPLALQKHAPDLYNVLSSYYRQNPAGRTNRTLSLKKGTNVWGGLSATKNDAVSGLTTSQSGDGLVDVCKAEIFDHRLNVVESCKIEHTSDVLRTSDRRTGSSDQCLHR